MECVCVLVNLVGVRVAGTIFCPPTALWRQCFCIGLQGCSVLQWSVDQWASAGMWDIACCSGQQCAAVGCSSGFQRVAVGAVSGLQGLQCSESKGTKWCVSQCVAEGGCSVHRPASIWYLLPIQVSVSVGKEPYTTNCDILQPAAANATTHWLQLNAIHC